MIPEFERILKQNGIKEPKNGMKKMMFDIKWGGAQKEYHKLVAEYQNRRFDWNILKNKYVFEEWEGEFPEFDRIVPFTFACLRFSSPWEAKRVIEEAQLYLEGAVYSRLQQKADEATEAARMDWIQKLSTSSVPFGSMIVLRRRDFNPSEEEEDLIALAVRNQHEYAVWSSDWRVQMIAFGGFQHVDIPKMQFAEFTPRDTIIEYHV